MEVAADEGAVGGTSAIPFDVIEEDTGQQDHNYRSDHGVECVPSDVNLKAAARKILDACDLSVMTLNGLRSQLEQQYGVSLSSSARKVVLREVIGQFIATNAAAVKYAQLVEQECQEAADAAEKEASQSSGKGGKGFAKAVLLAPELAHFLGAEQMVRTEVTKRLWAYIKEHDLQNPKNRREILLDEAMQQVFKRKKLDMFKMTKAVSAMMKSAADIQSDDYVRSVNEGSSAELVEGEEDDADNDSAASENESLKKRRWLSSSSAPASNKKQRSNKNQPAPASKVKKENFSGSGRGFAKAVLLAPELAHFLGAEQMVRTEVTKRLWAYIKEHDLQNPKNRREILLDEAMQQVFKRKKLDMFKMTKAVSAMMKSAADIQETSDIEEEDGYVEQPIKQEGRASSSSHLEQDTSVDKKGCRLIPEKFDSQRKVAQLKVEGTRRKVKLMISKLDEEEQRKLKSQPLAQKWRVSDELCAAIGIESDTPRTKVVSKMWEYIREHGLQNSNDKREILLDDRLKAVFRTDSFTMFSMNKFISEHMYRHGT